MKDNVVLAGNNVQKIYRNELNKQFIALKNINLKLYAGDFTVIMGPAGAGKSSLLYSLSGLEEINSGTIQYGEKNLALFSEQEKNNFRKNEIGFISHGSQLLPNLTIGENVALPNYLIEKNKDTAEQRATDILKTLGLTEQLNCWPGELSQGQQQLAVIARSLVNQPKIIFADEPTATLTNFASQEILDCLSELNQKKQQTIVLATDDLNVALRGNRLLYLNDGMICYDANLGDYHRQHNGQRKQQLVAFLTEWGW